MKQKIKIMKQNTDVSDEEIRSYMNFENLLTNNVKLKNAIRWRRIVSITVPLIVLSGLSAWFVMYTRYAPELKVQTPLHKQQQSGPDEKTMTPSPKAAEKDPKTQQLETDDQPITSTVPKAIERNETNEKEVPGATKQVYVQAEPVDGYARLYEYFNVHLDYPPAAVKDSIQGVVTVAFVIDENGKPEKITVRQSLGEVFDEEAIRVINAMPPWKAATLNGVPIASQMSIPLTFQVKRVNTVKP